MPTVLFLLVVVTLAALGSGIYFGYRKGKEDGINEERGRWRSARDWEKKEGVQFSPKEEKAKN